MSSSWIIGLEVALVLGVGVGLALWDLLRLRREMKRDREQARAQEPQRDLEGRSPRV